MSRTNPSRAEVPTIEETYDEYRIDSTTFAIIGHPTNDDAWILSDYTVPIER
ncbi:hypothetical protein [Natrarchaeobaculum sulfurireducens]|uniref:Uncharacterized protein n=1 Tax=Natrarchaeobaculum sulfurireducens TaxID=2044521 RepID=A0A346PCI5_9EURY|nr:hypothetical protein [Natrarchaeobaculum sulfurireducens]AXR77230.1 hypothetical protein AArc1_0889 [Natrarchaeobaculum sulfurireducens]